ncbi:MAG TPA: YciI family protein [Candidatus Baltobacteraceae bacterium]|nr:YciI family protein [Candidatus Baltobacteraceae bacterium]
MRILSIMTHDPATMKQPTQDDFEKMSRLIDEWREKGYLVDTGGAMPGSLEIRVSRKNGKDTITDGPFAEAKEVVGGFALLEVSSKEEALELTRRFLDLIGDATCELHEVSSA